ncbi:MAG: SGNH/GDSL hydrolase family protein, partial [Promethearchaeota archaeon]
VFLGVIEHGFRLLMLERRSDTALTPFIKDPVLGHVGRPNYKGWYQNSEYGRSEVQTNSMGFRDHRDYRKKDSAIFRILGLGDSFTWGAAAPYEDTYLRVAEKKLQQSVEAEIEIIKAGFSAYTLTQEVLFYKRTGKKFQPDLVTIGFLPNDLVSSYPLTPDGLALQKPENPYGLLKPSFFMKAAIFLSEKSRFYKWLKSLMLKNDRIYIKAYLSRGGEDSYVSKKWSPRYLKQLRLVRDLLKDLNEVVKQDNSKLVLIFIPQRFQILVAKHDELGARYQADKINREIEKVCNDLGIFYLDTFPHLLKASDQGPVFYTVDGHLNPRGYRIVGELLADFLVEKNLVPTNN